MSQPIRLAMWSGPRNISTAMMRAWGKRVDTFVCDEPLYAHYLKVTGKEHPAADEIIADGETDARKVAAWLTGTVPQGKHIFFQKHMTHHLLPDMDWGWLEHVSHCFLIRHPRDVLLSYSKIIGHAAAADTGFPQQLAIFNWVLREPRSDPAGVGCAATCKTGLVSCLASCVIFSASPLTKTCFPGSRECGPRTVSGPSTGTAKWRLRPAFGPTRRRTGTLPDAMKGLYEECLQAYEELYRYRMQ